MKQVLTLKQRPDLYLSTLDLVDHSFGNSTQYKIEVDFYPLFQEENWEHCFILIDDSGQLVAHLGVKIRQMSVGGKTFPIALLGGIAVKQEERGQGHFRTLFEEVIKRFENQVALFILWSEKSSLYEKFGFYQVGEVFESGYNGNNNQILDSTILKRLSQPEQDCIKKLYSSAYKQKYACLEREDDDWKAIFNITSAQLFVSRDHNKNITGYALKNKGMDLNNIIYEWHDSDLLKSHAFGEETKIWSPVPLGKDFDSLRMLFLGLVKIGDFNLFQQFFTNIFKGKFDLEAQARTFKILGDTKKDYSPQAILEMTFSNSISGKWPIYISGADSI